MQFRILATILLAAISSASCAPERNGSRVSDVVDGYRYDQSVGKCLNGAGQEGFNPPDVARFFERSVPYHDAAYLYTHASFPDGQGECADFSNFDFTALMGTNYASLTNWNFRGARLSGAHFMLSAIIDSDLAGADIAEFITGYIYVRGTIDKFTQLPTAHLCKVADTRVVCRN
jgi:hypothetical protein